MSIVKIADKAGVSYATVSRVINGRSGVSEQTAEKVRQVIRDLGYTPPPPSQRRGPNAAGRPGVRHGTLALLWTCSRDASMNSVANSLLHGATQAATRHGLNLVVDHIADSRQLPPLVETGKVDGVLLHGPEPDPETTEKLRHYPVVWLLSSGSNQWGDRVQPDNEAIAELALETLVERGHKQLACISSRPGSGSSAYWKRALAFQEAAERRGLHSVLQTEDHVAVRPDSVERSGDADAMARRLLALEPRPSGVFVANDLMIRLHHALLRQGVRPNQDIQIVCCNRENLWAVGVEPSPLVISIQSESIGHIAVEHVLWRLANQDHSGRMRILVGPKLLDPREDSERTRTR